MPIDYAGLMYLLADLTEPVLSAAVTGGPDPVRTQTVCVGIKVESTV